MKKIIVRFFSAFLVVLTGQALAVAQVATPVVSMQQPACTTLSYSLSLGKKDFTTKGQVTILQKFLRQKGYLLDAPTGYFGKVTQRAVMTFQNEYSIELTGLVGPTTREKINALTCLGAMPTSSSTTSSIASSTKKVDIGMQTVVQKNTVNAQNVPNQESLRVKEMVPEFAPYKVFVNGQVEIDASGVTKGYAEERCTKVADANKNNLVICVWGGKEFFTRAPITTIEVVSVTVPETPSGATPTPTSLQSTSQESGNPLVFLNIGPTSVPYSGGYDYFELKTVGMKTCTLYYKDEPSTSWVSAGSSLGVSFTLPAYKGMTKSRAYYASCDGLNGVKLDSKIVTILVAGR